MRTSHLPPESLEHTQPNSTGDRLTGVMTHCTVASCSHHRYSTERHAHQVRLSGGGCHSRAPPDLRQPARLVLSPRTMGPSAQPLRTSLQSTLPLWPLASRLKLSHAALLRAHTVPYQHLLSPDPCAGTCHTQPRAHHRAVRQSTRTASTSTLRLRSPPNKGPDQPPPQPPQPAHIHTS